MSDDHEPRDPLAPEVFAAVRSGNRQESLEAIRDYLAEQLESAKGRDAAPVARELRETIREIAAISTEGQADDVDEVAEQRRRRLADGA